MRTFDVDLFEFSARTNVQDFDGLAGFEQSFEFEWVNCFHSVPSGLKHNEARAPALIFRWLLLLKFWRLIDKSRWRASRYGIDGKLIDFDRKCERTSGELLREMLKFIAPEVEELGTRGRSYIKKSCAKHRRGSTTSSVGKLL